MCGVGVHGPDGVEKCETTNSSSTDADMPGTPSTDAPSTDSPSSPDTTGVPATDATVNAPVNFGDGGIVQGDVGSAADGTNSTVGDDLKAAGDAAINGLKDAAEAAAAGNGAAGSTPAGAVSALALGLIAAALMA